MAGPFTSFRTGPSLFNIPGAPTVSRLPGGQFGKLSEEVIRYYKEVAADALNDFTDSVARDSLLEVPKGPRHDSSGEVARHSGQFEEGSLAASIRYPANDHESRADPDYLVAWISYDSPYAAVQHEGEAVMLHHHPIIPGAMGFFERLDVEEPIAIEWRAENYTTPGTKSHFLSDPIKAATPRFEAFMYRRVREAFQG